VKAISTDAIKELRRRVNKARKFPTNTCPASRHLHIMADCLAGKRVYHPFTDEPVHCAETMYAVLASLWEARSEDGHDADRFRFLQSLPPKQAQAYFWNYASKKQRAKAIDQDMHAANVARIAAVMEPGQ
jgi:hypothetical protein